MERNFGYKKKALWILLSVSLRCLHNYPFSFSLTNYLLSSIRGGGGGKILLLIKISRIFFIVECKTGVEMACFTTRVACALNSVLIISENKTGWVRINVNSCANLCSLYHMLNGSVCACCWGYSCVVSEFSRTLYVVPTWHFDPDASEVAMSLCQSWGTSHVHCHWTHCLTYCVQTWPCIHLILSLRLWLQPPML